MDFVKEFNALVIAGSWNNAIFTPEWFAKYLIPNVNLNVEYPVNVNGSLRISTDEFRIFALENRLFFTVLKTEDAVFNKIEEMALKIADYLPHTPVTAFGFNYAFQGPINEVLSKYFNFDDSESLNGDGYKLGVTTIARSMVKDNHTLNLKISKSDEVVKFEFNFHFPIDSLVRFKEIFTPHLIVNHKNEAVKLLNDLYENQEAEA